MTFRQYNINNEDVWQSICALNMNVPPTDPFLNNRTYSASIPPCPASRLSPYYKLNVSRHKLLEEEEEEDYQ